MHEYWCQVFGNSVRHDMFSMDQVPVNSTEQSMYSVQDFLGGLSSILDEDFELFTSGVKRKEDSSKLISLKKALSLNTKMQALVEVEIKKLKASYEINLEKQAVIEKSLNGETEEDKNELKIRNVFATPYFHDVKKWVPPENEDTKIKRKNFDVNAYLKLPKIWSNEDNEKLLNSVKKFVLMSALKPYEIRKENLERKLKNKNLTNFETEELRKRLTDTDNKIKSVSGKSHHELLKEFHGRIDWLTISSVYMNALRSPEECESMWKNVLDPSINKKVFTHKEDEKLFSLAEKYNEREWDLIAQSLQTNRTPIQCFQRYQTKLNKKRRYWSKKEDDRLTTLVNELKYGEVIPWDKVSSLIEGRTHSQCRSRYKILSRVYNYGPWTPEEDGLLIACYDKFGAQWSKIKTFFKRRASNPINSRYILSLDPHIKFGCPWTLDEDKHLISIIKEYGYGQWSKICKEMPGRTAVMCMKRANSLLKSSIEYHSDQGTEYDIDIYDAELFAKILRPHASEQYSVSQSKVLRTVREDAIAALLKALEKVVPNVQIEVENLNSLNFSWLSYEQLHQISEELHNMFLQREKFTPPCIIPRNYPTGPIIRLRKKLFDETSDDDLSDDVEAFPVKKDEGNEWLDSVLATLIRMQAINIQPKVKKKPQEYSEREFAEISFYKTFLFKHLKCSTVSDEEGDKDATFDGIDYSETLETLVSSYIQPPVNENQFIVIAPNLDTICGLEVAEITENRLISMSEFVSHSKNYIDFVCKRRTSCPKCLQCLYKGDEQLLIKNAKTNQSGEISFQNMISRMKNKHFIVNEALETAACIEVASKEKCVETCSCASLEESQKSVQLLRKRFMAVFLLPALLATAKFTKEQDQILCEESESTKTHCFPRGKSRICQPKRKRRRTSKRKITENCEVLSSGETAAKIKKTYKKCKTDIPEELKRRSKRSDVVQRTLLAQFYKDKE